MTQQATTSSLAYRYSWDPTAFRRADSLVYRFGKHARWLQLVLKAGPWIGAAALLVWLSVLVGNKQWDALAAPSAWLILIALWIAFLKYGTGYMGARAWEKRHPIGHREIEVELSEAGFRTRSYPGELLIRWEAMLQVVETDEFLLFYSAPALAHYLPKVAIPAADLPPVRALLAQAKGKDFSRR